MIQFAQRGDVERARESGTEGDGAAVTAVVILGKIEALLGAEWCRDIGKDR